MEILIKIGQFLLSLTIIVVLHELGHFTFAKIFKTRVEKFYIFFNPWFSLFKIKRGETTYGLGWLPLGGYVKISGMIDESMDKEQMKQEPKPYEFRAKKAWKRLIIMLAGIFVNFILGFVIYASVLYTWGEDYLPTKNMEYGVVADSLAQSVGFKNGDKIVSLDNKPVEKYKDIAINILLDQPKTVQIIRDNKDTTLVLPESLAAKMIKGDRLFTPRIPFVVGGFSKNSKAEKIGILKGDRIVKVDSVDVSTADLLNERLPQFKNKQVNVTVLRDGKEYVYPVKLDSTAMLGVAIDLENVLKFEKIHYSFLEAIPAGVKKSYDTGKKYLQQFKLLFSPKTGAYKEIGGFITIGKIFPGTWVWQSFWNLTAFLSIMLAILNFLPIPALDGGHALFTLFEIITGKKPGDKFLEYAQIVGMVILLALVLFANGNDIVKLFG